MSYRLLIERLDGLKRRPEVLAGEIHGCWWQQRRREGWRLGPSSLAAKSSPYLKPLGAFSRREYEREVYLALKDVDGTIDALLRLESRARLESLGRSDPGPNTAAVAPTGLLRSLMHNPRFVDGVSAVVHASWRRGNLAFGGGQPDRGRDRPFFLLSAAEKRITRCNVQADIAAMSKLIRRDRA